MVDKEEKQVFFIFEVIEEEEKCVEKKAKTVALANHSPKFCLGERVTSGNSEEQGTKLEQVEEEEMYEEWDKCQSLMRQCTWQV